MEETLDLEVDVTEQKPEVHRFQFEGKGMEMFLLMLVNYILTILTIGIYSFWARTKTRKYIWSHTTFSGDRLEYTGTGKELYISAIKIGAVFLVYFLITGAITKMLPSLIIPLQLVTYIVVFLLVGFIQYSARNFRLARTRWRGIRLGMTDARKEYLKTYVIYTLLMPLTLGLIAPIRWVKLRSILISNTRVGVKTLTYTGKSDEIYGTYIKGLIFSFLTLGIYYFWHSANLTRYDFKNTKLGDARFKSVITGGDLFINALLSIVLVLVTFGLAAPWVIKMFIDLKTETLAVLGFIPFHDLEQNQEKGPSALGEEAAEFLDVDFGF